MLFTQKSDSNKKSGTCRLMHRSELIFPLQFLFTFTTLVIFSKFSHNICHLKGQLHEIFDPRFFSSINTT
jgi:hypothetical protein